MYSTYRLKPNELTKEFFTSFYELFKNKEIEITVHTIDKESETEYLLKSENNKKSLIESLNELESGKIVSVSLEELEKNADTL